MNAGAYGGEMKDIVESVTVLTQEGELLTLSLEEMKMGYRTSIVKEKGYIVASAVLKLRRGDRKAIQEKMDDYKERRVSKDLWICQARAAPLKDRKDILPES